MMSEQSTPGDAMLVRAVLDAVPEATVLLDGDGHIRYANPRMNRLFAYGAGELSGRPLEHLIPGWRARPTAELVDTQVVARRGDGIEMTVDVRIRPLGMGEAARIAVMSDASERIRLQDRLVILEAFVEASDDAIFTHDNERRITSWNRGAQRIFGYVREEILGQPSTILLPEHLRADATPVFDTVMAGDLVDHFETEAVRKDGLPIVISISLRPVAPTGRAFTSSILVARDITEQHLAQATLAEFESRGREREALAHVGSWLWDLRTGAVQWSDELYRIHGVDPLDFDGTLESHLLHVHPEDGGRVRSGMERAIASRGPFEDQYRIVRPGGEVRWIVSRAEPTVGSAGTVVGLRGIGQDVTDRRRPEPG